MNRDEAEALKNRARRLPKESNVENTARRLEKMHWTPELLVSTDDFPRIGRDSLVSMVEEVLSLDDDETERLIGAVSLGPERSRFTQASMLVNAAELLWRLRADEPEAWDSINELYEDD
jgi:hypothetical protein